MDVEVSVAGLAWENVQVIKPGRVTSFQTRECFEQTSQIVQIHQLVAVHVAIRSAITVVGYAVVIAIFKGDFDIVGNTVTIAVTDGAVQSITKAPLHGGGSSRQKPGSRSPMTVELR